MALIVEESVGSCVKKRTGRDCQQSAGQRCSWNTDICGQLSVRWLSQRRPNVVLQLLDIHALGSLGIGYLNAVRRLWLGDKVVTIIFLDVGGPFLGRVTAEVKVGADVILNIDAIISSKVFVVSSVVEKVGRRIHTGSEGCE